MQNDFEFHYAEVIRASKGASLVKVKIAAMLLGVSPQTIYNQVHEKKCKFDVIKSGAHSYIRALDLARHIAGISPVNDNDTDNDGTHTDEISNFGLTTLAGNNDLANRIKDISKIPRNINQVVLLETEVKKSRGRPKKQVPMRETAHEMR